MVAIFVYISRVVWRVCLWKGEEREEGTSGKKDYNVQKEGQLKGVGFEDPRDKGRWRSNAGCLAPFQYPAPPPPPWLSSGSSLLRPCFFPPSLYLSLSGSNLPLGSSFDLSTPSHLVLISSDLHWPSTRSSFRSLAPFTLVSLFWTIRPTAISWLKAGSHSCTFLPSN